MKQKLISGLFLLLLLFVSCKKESNNKQITENLIINVLKSSGYESNTIDSVLGNFMMNIYPWLMWGNSPLDSGNNEVRIEQFMTVTRHRLAEMQNESTYIDFDFANYNKAVFDKVMAIFYKKISGLDIDFSDKSWLHDEKKVALFNKTFKECLSESLK